MTPATRFIDVWFDNVFTDWSVRQNIRQAQDQAHRVRESIVAPWTTAWSGVGTSSRAQELADERASALSG